VQFLKEWLSKDDPVGRPGKDWCTEMLCDAAAFLCCLCICTLSCSKGIRALEKYARTEGHPQNMQNKLNPLQLQMGGG